MRGSPLIRTLMVLAALCLTGLGLARLLNTPPAVKPVAHVEKGEEEPTAKVPFELILSAQAAELHLDAGGVEVVGRNTAEPLAGTLELKDRAVTLRVRWADASPGHRFAKLRLDLPGKETLEHVFTAPGDIEDVWEVEP